MISNTTRKWQKKVKELEDSLHSAKYRLENANESLSRKEGKLQVYEDREARERNTISNQMNSLQDQVNWLRSLVEKLTIPPATIKALSNERARVEQEQRAWDRQRQKDQMKWDRIRMKQQSPIDLQAIENSLR